MAKKEASVFVRQLGVSFLILLFAFAIMPVALLHDAVTNHKDVCYHNFQQKEKSISKADINCHCLSFVADVHFTPSFQPASLRQLPAVSPVKNQFYSPHFYSQHHFFAGLRGPPSLV